MATIDDSLIPSDSNASASSAFNVNLGKFSEADVMAKRAEVAGRPGGGDQNILNSIDFHLKTRAQQAQDKAGQLPSEEILRQRSQQAFQDIRAQRKLDTAEGDVIAQREFGEGALGRVEEARSNEVADIIERRRALANQAGNVQAQEEAAQNALDIQSQKNLRQIRGQLGAQGIRGGLNVESQLGTLGQRNLAESGLQAQLASQRFGQQQAAISGLESSVLGAEETEAGRRMTNERRALNERLGRISLPLQFAQLGATDRATASADVRSAALAQAQVAQSQAALQNQRIMAEKPAPEPQGGKIICGELFRQGLLSEQVYIGDLQYAKGICQDTKDGYLFWSPAIVRLMKKSPLFTKAVALIAKGWAVEMAFRVGKSKKGSLMGKFLTFTAEPACKLLGKLLKKVKAI